MPSWMGWSARWRASWPCWHRVVGSLEGKLALLDGVVGSLEGKLALLDGVVGSQDARDPDRSRPARSATTGSLPARFSAFASTALTSSMVLCLFLALAVSDQAEAPGPGPAGDEPSVGGGDGALAFCPDNRPERMGTRCARRKCRSVPTATMARPPPPEAHRRAAEGANVISDLCFAGGLVGVEVDEIVAVVDWSTGRLVDQSTRVRGSRQLGEHLDQTNKEFFAFVSTVSVNELPDRAHVEDGTTFHGRASRDREELGLIAFGHFANGFGDVERDGHRSVVELAGEPRCPRGSPSMISVARARKSIAHL